MSDPRYTIRLEYCGYETPRWVVRFCGDWVGQREYRIAARRLARQHNKDRLK